jgi:hypothetical protein
VALLVGFRPPDRDPQAVVGLLDVGGVERDELSEPLGKTGGSTETFVRRSGRHGQEGIPHRWSLTQLVEKLAESAERALEAKLTARTGSVPRQRLRG